MLETAVEVSDRLAAEDCAARVVSMHTIQPIDVDEIAAAAAETGGIVTIEEHVLNGGLGGAVAEVMADYGLVTSLTRLGIPNRFLRSAGTHEHLRSQVNLDPESVLRAVRHAVYDRSAPVPSG